MDHEKHTMNKGIILKGVGGFYEVWDADDPQLVYTCRVRGVHRKSGGTTPLPGDDVTFRVLDEAKKLGHIEDILTRRNEFIRPPVANIEQVGIVVSIKSPEPDLGLVDKLLITCEIKAIQPFIIINKSDLDTDDAVKALEAVYAGAGYPVLVLSKMLDEGYEALHQKLSGRRTAFAGQSGVGKSTIVNRILDDWMMETGSVSERIQRGKHTTRHVQLFLLDQGGFLVDTPGFSSFAVTDMEHQLLADCYPEFRECSGECRFKGCSHVSEPDCHIRSLVSDGCVDKGRYERYTQIYKELKEAYDNRYRR